MHTLSQLLDRQAARSYSAAAVKSARTQIDATAVTRIERREKSDTLRRLPI